MQIVLVLFFSIFSLSAQACPYAKLIQRVEEHRAESKKKELPRPIFSDDVLENPLAPKFVKDPFTRAAIRKEWNKHVLRLAEKSWNKLGVAYQRMPYKNGDALVVLPGEQTPLNRIARFAQSIENKTGYRLQMVFSPDSLVQERYDSEGNVEELSLALGSFQAGSNTLHLPFKSMTELKLNPTLRHELLHAHFDYLAEMNRTSLINGAFSPTDKKGPYMWKGLTYRDHLSVEEIATFPVNLEDASKDLKALLTKPASVERNAEILKWMNKQWGRILQTALNAKRIQNALGHFERALRYKGPTKTLTEYKLLDLGGPDGKYLQATLTWLNALQPLAYKFRIPESHFKEPFGKPQRHRLRRASTFAAAYEPPNDEVADYISLQHGIAKDVWQMHDALLQKTRKLVTKIKDAKETVSNVELKAYLDLVTSPRAYTLQFINPKNAVETSNVSE